MPSHDHCTLLRAPGSANGYSELWWSNSTGRHRDCDCLASGALGLVK